MDRLHVQLDNYILLISLRFDEFGGIADKSSNFYGLPFDRGFCFFHF